MRLHFLELTGFGPFVGTEKVDFDALGADGLFLLHGDTGAGKTTLLDAVAFALFGAVPGARAEAKRLRCDYADPDTHTEVTLELTVQHHRLRITRSPEYERPKRRGGGTTKQQAKASLTWVGAAPSGHRPEGVTRIDEVARVVERLLGMTKEQFFQVVLLPQGEFARFLRSSTEEREKLLEKLFGTEHFERVEQWFRDQRRELGRERDERQAASTVLLARFAQAAGIEPPERSDLPWLDGILTDAEQAAEKAAEAAAATAKRRVRAEDALLDGRDLQGRVKRVHRAVNGLAELAHQAAERIAWRDELAAAERAVPVVTATEQLMTLERRADDADAVVTDCAEKVAARGVEEADAALPTLREAVGKLREEAGGLAKLVAEAEHQRADKRRLSALVEREEAIRADLVQIERRLTSYPDQLVKAREALTAATTARAELVGLRARRSEIDAALGNQKALPAARKAVVGAEDAARAATDKHQAAREEVQRLRQLRLDGMAAELAAGLSDGDPCPVCGGHEHPHPASTPTGAATAADEQRAQTAEVAALRVREQAGIALTRARSAVDTLLERLTPWEGQDIAAAYAEADKAFVASNELASRYPTLERTLRNVERDHEALRNEHAKQEVEAGRLSAEGVELKSAILRRESIVDEARGEHTSVVERRQHVLDTVTAIDTLIEAHAKALTAHDRVREQRDALADQVSVAGFLELAEALAAARTEPIIDKLRSRLVEATEAEQQHRATLSDPDLFGIEADLDVDLAPLLEAATAARESAENAVAVARETSMRLEQLAGLGALLQKAWAELAPIEAEFAELDALTDVVNGRGQNSTKMSLRSYVLAARLEEVATAASQRLRKMTQGRYSFEHSDQAGARGTRGGLGLDVLDDYSGMTRPAKTLSGGESFVASLALALGLADVVAAESGGGALLDTLFVDEGFGTLDAGTLDEVMAILDELRDGGRVVGIVSHVDELRQRIPTRVKVLKGRGGSTLRLSV
ncbi:AAA family ATPase [Actinokineospora globicatena]|uniref:AAA family ATPase n=1 Tax=Actinokineospora globicatena TaxID=103729 RepID=UPI0020A59AD2|nr:SMC family ATPase [Actinokineospora globicatena]MCP2300526.1 exonuclease SbcC [Actinokineospora globicatena]GLW81069.1 nuclease SbcCD subunit C [Actinokineospora globicatena]GLW88262.1 nuclease SbcCD subunit C [Actinokineospora globicatena]